MRRFIITSTALISAAILIVGIASAAHARDDARLTLDPTEQVTWASPVSELCSRGCRGDAAWLDDSRVSDPALREALFALSQYMPALKDILDYNARAGTRLIVEDPDNPLAGGTYSPDERLIRIRRDQLQLGVRVVAVIVAHELVHGTQDHSDPSLGCQREVEAYAWEAATWQHIKRPSDSRFQVLDQIVQAWHGGWLSVLVASWPLYSDVCGVQ